MNNCTVSGNSTDVGEAALFVQGSIAHVKNSIFWNNGSDFEFIDDAPALAVLTVNYTLTQQGFTGTGNISPNPLFANAANGDFHVKSKNGRFDPATGQFVKDDVDSPAIDAGDPSSDFSNEPEPNGGRVNLGCYGNTAEASKSAATGVEELRVTNYELRVYPNPTAGELTVAVCGERYAVSNIAIYDMYGRSQKPEVRSQKSKGEISINVEALPAGIYFLKIGEKMAKFVKR
jgi:hypothetical protein